MDYNLIIIGSGPGGYVAAIRAAQLGLKVALIEKENLGGICLNWGCIPTKALLKSAEVLNYAKNAIHYGINVEQVSPDIDAIVARSRSISESMSKGVDYLIKKNKIDLIYAHARLKAQHTIVLENKAGEVSELTADHIILATGARARHIPNLPIDGKYIISYKEALVPKQIPTSLAVVGSGAIGVEMAYFYRSLGCEVTIIEFQSHIVPLEDADAAAQLSRSFRKMGIKVCVDTAVESVKIVDDNCVLLLKTKKGEQELHCQQVLSAVGVVANIDDLGLEALGIECERGKIKTDSFYRTNVEGVYAIGDIIGSQALAHVASAEAIVCVEKIFGLNPDPIDYTCIPACIYTVPELASVGMTEQAAKLAGYDVRIGKFPFTASGKATTSGDRDGFAKLVFDIKTDRLLGASLVGMHVTELIAELCVTYKMGTQAKQLLKIIHPHPTMSETIMEAAALAHNEAIHY